MIAPTESEVKPVVDWLKSSGVQQIDVSGRDVIKVVAPVRAIERMFQTTMYNFRSKQTGTYKSDRILDLAEEWQR